MLRLVVFSPSGVRHVPMVSGPLRIGGSDSCDVVLERDAAGDREAVLERERGSDRVRLSVPDGGLPVEVNGHSCLEADLATLDEIKIGRVTLLVEDSNARSQELVLPSLRLDGRAAADSSHTVQAPGEPSNGGGALSGQNLPARLLEHLSRLSEWVAGDSASAVSVESIVVQVLHDFGGGACFLFEGPLEPNCGVKFAAASDPALVGKAEPVLHMLCDGVKPDAVHSFGEQAIELGDDEFRLFFRRLSALERDYTVAILLVDAPPFERGGWTPVLGFATLADLLVLGLVHHVGRYEPILPGREPAGSLRLAPGLVLGPSHASSLLGEAIRSASRGAHVVLQGEAGSGHELVARSLHLSGPTVDEPFLVVDCEEPNAKRLRSELFGAEIEGRTGPVRREGKLRAAGRGTVFLRRVEALPLDAQGELVRILRSAELQGPGELEVSPFSARLIASSHEDLEELCERGRFRRDLLHRLAQLTVLVPALHERRDDLPLLLQSLVNRFSHETGKRVRGITVRALSLLTAYRFPGNLRELENVVRHMVYLAQPETPMDVDCLPVQIRTPAPGQRADPSEISGSELRLTDVVGRVERHAIREALRQSQGNKSQAARLLGLSRNGLAQKMSRHGLDANE